jgi:lipopolysaccharide/colanic/teichoic acid biosynthesis glycosyltransferase
MQRLSVTPGMTCIWQVSGRSEIDWDEWIELDLQYIRTWSLLLDFKILLLTIPAVLSSRGAY